jgi:hypothetical protein
MKKHTIHGLPITPRAKIEELAGGSFCVSYATCSRRTVDDAIRLVGADGIVMLDNGAFSHWRKGKGRIDIDGFEAWANEILARCDNAVAVIPDVIGGTERENDDLINECWMDWDRCMVVWHMHEGIERLLRLCENFNYVAIGSSGDYAVPGTAAWHARMREAFAAIDKWEAECEGAYCRPRLHLMRAQAFADEYPFDSSDSCTVAMTHWRRRNKGKTVACIAARINERIQASAGDEAEHQAKRPLDYHVEAREAQARFWIDMEFERVMRAVRAAAKPAQYELPLAA